MKHLNIPIFIPHLGCPNQCIFCNQKYISGNEAFDEGIVEKTINEVLSTVSEDCSCEIAFFGGSFTGIDRSLMLRLLNLAQEYVDNGKVKGIRMSTRPDYISEEITTILLKYSVSCVELGIQTMNDEVLRYLKRGHTVSDSLNAMTLLNKVGIPFVGQMMIGLPTATLEDELECAKVICSYGAKGARIYPTLVLKNTELESITSKGEYIPLTIEDAVIRASKVLKIFNNNNVPCIRIGLCDSENLHSDKTFIAGPNCPSIGEMIISRVFYENIVEMIDRDGLNTELHIIIECANGKVSQVIGNKKENIIKLKTMYGFKTIKVVENKQLNDFEINILKKEETICV